MAKANVLRSRDVKAIPALLDSPEVAALIADLEETRGTGRPGYPIRSMVGMALVKSLYVLPTWSRTARLVAEHKALQDRLAPCPACTPAIGSRRSCVSTRRSSTPASPRSSPR